MAKKEIPIIYAMKMLYRFSRYIILLFSGGLSNSKSAKLFIGNHRDTTFGKEKLTEAELNHHVHIVGASGFGKTVLLTKILKSKIEKGDGALWLDLKGDRDTINEMIEIVEKAGRKEDLRIFSISHPDLSGKFNLVENGNATEICDKLIGSFEWTETYYKEQAQGYLLKLLIALCWLRDNQGVTFDIEKILECVTSQEAVEKIVLQIPTSALKIRLKAEACYEYLNTQKGEGNLLGLRTKLEFFVLSSYGEFLASDPKGINLFKEVNEQKIVFIFLDSRRYKESAKAIARIIVKDLISTSARIDAEIPKKLRKPFVCMIDEFADIATEDFAAFPDRARSSKMSLVLSHQELSQLKAVSPEFADSMTVNMSTLYAFLQSNHASAEAISKRAGTRTAWKETYKAERWGPFTVRTGDKSLREVEEFNIHPNVVKSLRVGECVVIKKYPYARSHVIRVSMDR